MMDYVKKYASEEALRQSEQDAVSSSSESSMSDFSEDEAQVSYSRHSVTSPSVIGNIQLTDINCSFN